MTDFAWLTIAEASERIRTRQISPVEYTQALIARIEKHDPSFNTFLRFTPELALKDARTAEAEIQSGRWRGPMHGVPYGLKDIIDYAGPIDPQVGVIVAWDLNGRLIGTVVNNPILIVDQALQLVRHRDYAPTEAILEAVRSRIRPIFMTTMTTVLGLLPLVLFPGAGSELYRGLGAVLLGGLLVATFVTLVLVPVLLGLCFRFFPVRPEHRAGS